MKNNYPGLGLLLILTAAMALAQPVPPAPAAPPPPAAPRPAMAPRAPQPPQPPQPFEPHRPPMERALHAPAPGKWWRDPGLAQRLALTSDQQKRMDEIFQQHRLKLIDLNAALQKEETIMEPLVDAEQPDEAKILSQIDRVAQARAELEKANARMLLGIRRVLNQDQWKKLQAEENHPRLSRAAP
jgi:Spy/CpxP family protein refolding chaperone